MGSPHFSCPLPNSTYSHTTPNASLSSFLSSSPQWQRVLGGPCGSSGPGEHNQPRLPPFPTPDPSAPRSESYPRWGSSPCSCWGPTRRPKAAHLEQEREQNYSLKSSTFHCTKCDDESCIAKNPFLSNTTQIKSVLVVTVCTTLRNTFTFDFQRNSPKPNRHIGGLYRIKIFDNSSN